MQYRSQRLKPVLALLALPFAVVFSIVASQASALAAQPMVAVGWYHTVGLRSDGTVVAVGSNGFGKLNVSSWREIKQVAAGTSHTVGLKSDGTVVTAGSNYYGQENVRTWRKIEQVAADQGEILRQIGGDALHETIDLGQPSGQAGADLEPEPTVGLEGDAVKATGVGRRRLPALCRADGDPDVGHRAVGAGDGAGDGDGGPRL